MTLIPGTKTKAVFFQVGTHVDGGVTKQDYPPLYGTYGGAGLSVASMNAGNSDGLYVGGGGINAGFAHVLRHTQTIGSYANLHTAMATKVAPDTCATQTQSDDDPCAAMTLCNRRLSGAKNHAGLAFVDAFADARCPHGDTANRAMVYVAPPLVSDYDTGEALIADIKAVAETSIEALVAYNIWAAAQAVPDIEALRLCAYSTGIYHSDGVSKADIGLAIFEGIANALAKTGLQLAEVQMPVGNPPTCDPLFSAVQTKLEG